MKSLIFLILAFILGIGPAFSGPEQGARKALAAFQCGVYLETMTKVYKDDGKKIEAIEERKRLFDFGYAAGLEFLKAAEKTPQLVEGIPWVLGMRNGPNFEFILGRWFEYAIDDAYEKITKEIVGLSKEIDERSKHDNEIRAIWAGSLYLKGNCELLGR